MVNTNKGLLKVTQYSSYWKSIIHIYLYFINYTIRCSLSGTINSKSILFLDKYVISAQIFIQGVSGGIVKILGVSSMDYSE